MTSSCHAKVDWSEPCLPSCVRRPAQVWQDASGGVDDGSFESLPQEEQDEYCEVACMELAAFLAWLLSQSSGRGAAGVLADARRRKGVLEEVEQAWAALSEESKNDWLPADYEAFLRGAWIQDASSTSSQSAPSTPQRASAPKRRISVKSPESSWKLRKEEQASPLKASPSKVLMPAKPRRQRIRGKSSASDCQPGASVPATASKLKPRARLQARRAGNETSDEVQDFAAVGTAAKEDHTCTVELREGQGSKASIEVSVTEASRLADMIWSMSQPDAVKFPKL
mmetsp:Transcript_12564/g.22187  ORF Transcript_12564/g.22187 Transcript_12564/m.22187 type:complete len:283 (+) Transcript_12564:40-888(+)|eukprot:CAMPEP_0197621482 /NCGR_PEP_ID=MMETSP1338-20131121/2070_1 /TAXON_ID=43686 ORGANISM="Pelagodinium beii, Strain RCC1491" /NCGR_SAMPLE_ID=MMETSP1338 /ASSEMBLY_ACC=CAM_ASM_000754 /LENGTH=282 /DNA_ID=CAMNT_0043190977 /DNA_START=34 /DNA_END=882 /DNA_ORIENTATION=-